LDLFFGFYTTKVLNMAKRKLIARDSIKSLKKMWQLKAYLQIRDRIRALILALEGLTDQEIADRMGYSLGWVKKWISRYSKNGFAGLYDQKRSGAPPFLTDIQIEQFYEMIIAGPDPDDILSRYRISDLIELAEKYFGVTYSSSGMHALLKRMELSYVKPRPQHPKNDPAQMKDWEKKAKKFLKDQKKKHAGKKIEVWYQDEARFGQKGIVTKIWTKKGNRPTRVRQNGFQSASIVGAVNPKTGEKYSLLYDGLDTEVMNHFLKNMGAKGGTDVHHVMFLDGAKWHQSENLVIPKNISLYFLPPYSPELNPIEQIWGYLKSNFLSGRIFKNMSDILDYGVRAWRELSQDIVKSVCAGGLTI
jgi:transposase